MKERCALPSIGATLTVAVIADRLPEAALFAAWARAAATMARPNDSYRRCGVLEFCLYRLLLGHSARCG
jgi:hypothetical protein